MKKIVTLIFAGIFVTSMLLLSGCDGEDATRGVIYSNDPDVSSGTICLFQANSEDNYLDFLANFDYDKNEIIAAERTSKGLFDFFRNEYRYTITYRYLSE